MVAARLMEGSFKPIVPPAADQSDTGRIAPGHQPIAVVLDMGGCGLGG
jgi:hypothetical protein